MIKVTSEELAYHTLRGHSLTSRVSMIDALKVIESICGLNAQGALNYNLSLWARVDGLNNQYVRDALRDKSLLRSWFMRNTVHIMTTNQALIARPALRETLIQEWNRWSVKTGSKKNSESWNIHYDKIHTALEERPLSISELLSRYTPKSENPKRVLSRTVREMSLKGLICNAESKGPWYHDVEHTYTNTRQWLKNMKEVEESQAQQCLMIDYLGAYGPASVQDYAYWTGMKISAAREVLKKIESELTIIEASGHKRKLYVPLNMASDLDKKEIFPFVRLLPKFDALIMGHKDKTRFMDELTRKRIFLPTAEVSASVLVDGRVEGVWTIKKDRDTWILNIKLFKELDEEHIDMLSHEIQSMKKFTGFEIKSKQELVFIN